MTENNTNRYTELVIKDIARYATKSPYTNKEIQELLQLAFELKENCLKMINI